jgi:hypothetical protein
MKKISSGNLALYLSIFLYAVYIFLVNWTAAADKTANASWLSEFFAISSNAVLAVCCLAIIYKLLKNISYYAKRKWLTLFVICILCFLAFTVKSISIVLPLIIGFVAIRSDNRIIAKIIAVSFSILLLISSIFYVFGLNGGDTISKPLFGDDSYYSVVVPALGMSNPNGVMMIFTIVIITILYLCSTRRQSRNASFLLTILTIILSLVTGSTTGLLIGLLSIGLMWFVKYGKNTPKRLSKIAPWTFTIVTILTFYIAVAFGPTGTLPNPVNDAFTTRPYMWNLRIENESYINIYGDNDKYISDGSKAGNDTAYALDNMTLYILVKYGAIIYLIFFYIFYRGARKINDPALLVLVVIACLLMLVERMYLYSVVFIFLQKAIIEHQLIERGASKRRVT